MKTTTFIVLMLLIATLSSAQSDTVSQQSTKSRNVKLDVFAGYTMAFGKYINTDRDDGQSGYAANGFFIQVSGSWLGKRGLGLGLSYCFQNNAIAAPDTIPAGHYEPLGSKHWSNHYLLAGPVFSREFGKWLLTLKFQGGGVLSFSPAFRIWMPSSDSLNINDTRLSDGPGFGVAMQALAGIGYRVTNNLSVNLAFSYLGGNPVRMKSYSQYIYETDPATGVQTPVFVKGEIERKKKISTFNIGLGLVFKL
ncbi:hypothetical protein ACFLS7_02565 [Bacteroidota bacterium]